VGLQIQREAVGEEPRKAVGDALAISGLDPDIDAGRASGVTGGNLAAWYFLLTRGFRHVIAPDGGWRHDKLGLVLMK